MKRFATNPFPEKEIFRHDRDVRFQGSTERLAHARMFQIFTTLRSTQSGFLVLNVPLAQKPEMILPHSESIQNGWDFEIRQGTARSGVEPIPGS